MGTIKINLWPKYIVDLAIVLQDISETQEIYIHKGSVRGRVVFSVLK